MRNVYFYKKIFGNEFVLMNENSAEDIVKIFDVDQIIKYEKKILQQGGNLTVPITDLNGNKKVAYFSDPDGYVFALLENGNYK